MAHFGIINPDACNFVLLKYKFGLNSRFSVNQQRNELLTEFVKYGKRFLIYSTFDRNSDKSILNPPLIETESCGSDPKRFEMESYHSPNSKGSDKSGISNEDLILLVRERPFIRVVRICGGGNVSETGIRYVCEGLQRLDKLTLEFCTKHFTQSITGEAFSRLTSIRSLSLCANQPNAPIFKCLQFLSRENREHLSELTVTAEPGIELDGNILEFISEHFLELRRLQYLVQTNRTGFGILRQMLSLTHLEFESSSSTLNDKELMYVLGGFQRLSSLIIRHNETIPNQLTLQYSPLCNTSLRELQFRVLHGSLSSFSNSALRRLAGTHLRSLVLESFHNITHQTVIDIINRNIGLNRLVLIDCPLVSASAVVTKLIDPVKIWPQNPRFDISMFMQIQEQESGDECND